MSGFKLSSDTLRSMLGRCDLVLLCAVSLTCDESLPPRGDPQSILQASLSVVEGVVMVQPDGNPSNAGVFTLTVRNMYNEVLQADALLEGQIEVWLKDDPARRTVVQLNRSDLANSQIASLNVTTLRPDSPAVFVKQWSHMTMDGRPMWAGARLHPRVTNHGVKYCESEPVSFVAGGTMRLFKNVAGVKTDQIRFALIYQIFGINCD